MSHVPGRATWDFYIDGSEIVLCLPRDAIADLGEHIHVRMNGPTALLVGGGLLHLLEHDRDDGGQLWATIKETIGERLA